MKNISVFLHLQGSTPARCSVSSALRRDAAFLNGSRPQVRSAQPFESETGRYHHVEWCLRMTRRRGCSQAERNAA